MNDNNPIVLHILNMLQRSWWTAHCIALYCKATGVYGTSLLFRRLLTALCIRTSQADKLYRSRVSTGSVCNNCRQCCLQSWHGRMHDRLWKRCCADSCSAWQGRTGYAKEIACRKCQALGPQCEGVACMVRSPQICRAVLFEIYTQTEQHRFVFFLYIKLKQKRITHPIPVACSIDTWRH